MVLTPKIRAHMVSCAAPHWGLFSEGFRYFPSPPLPLGYKLLHSCNCNICLQSPGELLGGSEQDTLTWPGT